APAAAAAPAEIAPAEIAPDAEGAPAEPPAPSLRRDLGGIAQVLLLIPVLWGLGFLAGLPLYVIGIVRYHGHGWGIALALAAGTLATAYLLFWQVLSIPLPMLPLFLD
ncbi:tripartite tricarboxylate transporter TctB family protein, partial [Propylenella binzhouense]